ncbi:hypothetical protein CONPUDRAFT_147557 [Coniophora puteana RWD-64-598 SS2]|uniref:F-box domain-containing protein n=1 Tax=Coniophora puteana (strain RWD-64-598) TaxID=741705 RepID=A0A5M3M7L1_CONPW|nr:uncharacterized protein CONPUDRAFT_147557 [Coniophora puteana RWD-64-598 SS2]EIW75023.1 hypothetical protein CONPUDRAFT_147557 [Coniophora puteana RWD-64-598 SS2]
MSAPLAAFLPDDVLILIFKACSPFDPVTLPHLTHRECGPPLWVPVTQISYGQLDCKRCSRWGKEMLNRSGDDTALYVYSRVRTGSPGWNTLIKNMGRTREMVHEEGMVSDLQSIMATVTSAPILESLFLSFSRDSQEVLTLPFGPQHIPRLKRLSLGIPLQFNWYSVSPFTQLAVLKIGGSIEDPDAEFPRFLAALSCMQALEKLSLKISVPHGKQKWTQNQGLGATLPKLNHLSLLANYTSCISLLPRILFNRKRATLLLTVEDDSSRPQGNPISTFAQQLLAENVEAGQSPQDSWKQSLAECTARNHSRFAIEASAGSARVTFYFQLFPRPDAEPCFELNYNVFGAVTRDILAHYADALPIASVQTVCIRSFVAWSRQLPNPFDLATSATTLQLTKTNAEDSTAIFSGLHPQDGRLPLPNLHKVVIEGTKYSVPRISRFFDDVIMPDVVVECPRLSELKDCILARRPHGCRLKRVVCARTCDSEAGHADDLRALGIEVDLLPNLHLTSRPRPVFVSQCVPLQYLA